MSEARGPRFAPLGVALHGPLSYRWRTALLLLRTAAAVTVRRLLRGPLLPGWPWIFEAGTAFLRAQTRRALTLPTIAQQRAYLDTLSLRSPAERRVSIEPVDEDGVRGRWFVPDGARGATMLYFHGGGYAVYLRAHDALLANVAVATGARVFALDYRLAPEHPFPAQLEDALAAWAWLRGHDADPRATVIAGDSSGGNLCLALLLALRDAGLPRPALGVCLSPWVDITGSGESMTGNAHWDWVMPREAAEWGRLYCAGHDPRDPLISPIGADLSGLPPVYIQCGGAEILRDQIRTLARRAAEQGADVKLEEFEHMNHEFQTYGDRLAPARDALLRIGETVRAFTGAR